VFRTDQADFQLKRPFYSYGTDVETSISPKGSSSRRQNQNLEIIAKLQ